ncbi:MAG: hypothetical protein ACP5PP_02485 [Fervidobacterium sp.]|jgi:glycerol uptake facilitator-like aquaporin
MEREELEKKLLETIDRIETHLERYERDMEAINVKIDLLTNDLYDAWNTLRNIFITVVFMFTIMAVTWFFPFQARAYGYLSVDDVRRKLIALSVEFLIFGIILLFELGIAFSRRFRR